MNFALKDSVRQLNEFVVKCKHFSNFEDVVLLIQKKKQHRWLSEWNELFMILLSQVWSFKFQQIAQRANQVSSTNSPSDENAK
jgi:hypothetical protein